MADREMSSMKGKRGGRPMGAVGSSMIDSAREDGRKARLAGKRRDEGPILSDYPVKGCKEAWVEGWDAAVPKIATALPVVTTAPVLMQTRGAGGRLAGATYLPDDQPMPEVSLGRPLDPCDSCRATLLAGGARAVLCEQTNGGFRYLRCRACGVKFKRRQGN